jgi:hypothetical protein
MAAIKPDTRPFLGISSPRQLRVATALMTTPRSRKAIDSIAGCSNGPDVILNLRKKGLTIPCDNVSYVDGDGHAVTHGVYSFTLDDKRKVGHWLAQQTRGKQGGAK